MRSLTVLKNLLLGRKAPPTPGVDLVILGRSTEIINEEIDPLPFATIAAEEILKAVRKHTVPLPFDIEGFVPETHDYHIFGNWSVLEPDSAVDLQRFQTGCQELAKVIARFGRKAQIEFESIEAIHSGPGQAVCVQLGDVVVYCSTCLKTNLLIELTVRVRRNHRRKPETPYFGRSRQASEPSRVAYQNSRKFGFYVHE